MNQSQAILFPRHSSVFQTEVPNFLQPANPQTARNLQNTTLSSIGFPNPQLNLKQLIPRSLFKQQPVTARAPPHKDPIVKEKLTKDSEKIEKEQRWKLVRLMQKLDEEEEKERRVSQKWERLENAHVRSQSELQ